MLYAFVWFYIRCNLCLFLILLLNCYDCVAVATTTTKTLLLVPQFQKKTSRKNERNEWNKVISIECSRDKSEDKRHPHIAIATHMNTNKNKFTQINHSTMASIERVWFITHSCLSYLRQSNLDMGDRQFIFL